MTNEGQMALSERGKYPRLTKKRYLNADKFERGRLLDEMEAITGLQGRSLIRVTSGSVEQKPCHNKGDVLADLKLMTRCGSSPIASSRPGEDTGPLRRRIYIYRESGRRGHPGNSII